MKTSWMGLFDLVEEHDRVGSPPHRLGEVAPFFVAHVAGRCPDEPRDRVPLLKLTHVDPHDRLFVVEEEFREGLCQLRLAHTSGAHEEERAQGPVRVLQACPGPPDGVGYGRYGLVLSDDPLMEALFHMDHLLPLALRASWRRGCRSIWRRPRRYPPRPPLP